jgi:hypothetical protein
VIFSVNAGFLRFFEKEHNPLDGGSYETLVKTISDRSRAGF